jgi:O-acetyl-ADP-ribose deacetylase (regulator of RNase III)
MITYAASDLFKSDAQVLVNAVNTVGAMGKGIALAFKQKYPEMFEQYRVLCKSGAFDIGQLWLYKSPEKWILNFPTKRDWRDKSQIEYVEAGLKRFVEIYEAEGISSISFPRLGCGLGGLNWENEVRPLMERYLNPLPISISIHIPEDTTA